MADLKIGSLCSGAGLLDLSVMDVLDASVAWHCQYDPDDKHQYAAKILDAHWPGVPNHGDITTADWASVEPIDILTAGFPCQPVSNAGKRKGHEDDRWLWPDVARAVRVLRPRLVLLENVSALLVRGFGAVADSLAEIGYDFAWTCLRASDVGAAHRRERIFILVWPADPQSPRLEIGWEGRPGGVAAVQDADGAACGERRFAAPGQAESGRPRPDLGGRGGAPAADAGRFEPERRGGLGLLGGPAPAEQGEGHQRQRAGDTAIDRGPALADADRSGARPEPDREPHCPEADDEYEVGNSRGRVLDWGVYGPAVQRWECLSRPAPAPTEPGKTGDRLSSQFVEWMQGLAAGWVTGLGLPRSAELKALGNLAMPQQAAEAIRRLMNRASVPSLPVPSTEKGHADE